MSGDLAGIMDTTDTAATEDTENARRLKERELRTKDAEKLKKKAFDALLKGKGGFEDRFSKAKKKAKPFETNPGAAVDRRSRINLARKRQKLCVYKAKEEQFNFPKKLPVVSAIYEMGEAEIDAWLDFISVHLATERTGATTEFAFGLIMGKVEDYLPYVVSKERFDVTGLKSVCTDPKVYDGLRNTVEQCAIEYGDVASWMSNPLISLALAVGNIMSKVNEHNQAIKKAGGVPRKAPPATAAKLEKEAEEMEASLPK